VGSEGGDVSYHKCPDCRNEFVQPFVCITCGAQKLYDETVRSQAATIERLRAELADERHMHSEVDAALKEQVDETERLRKEIAKATDKNENYAATAHALVTNLNSRDDENEWLRVVLIEALTHLEHGSSHDALLILRASRKKAAT
jgi:septal ring factor EnvC (AmiA/AmiB activator)